MDAEGPDLEVLLRRLTDCPREFLGLAAGKATGADLRAIVCDALRPMMRDSPPELNKTALAAAVAGPIARQTVVSIVCWLIRDDWFVTQPRLSRTWWSLLESDELTRLAALVKPEKLVDDADRREELARIVLRLLGLRPRGETVAQAADRLTTLDSVERDRVLRATAAAEKRAREVREAMARAKAQDAASRYGE